MEYKVKVNGELSQPFKSLWGILAGDSASPAFFNFYMSDYSPPECDMDIIIDDVHVHHLEQADDIVTFTQTSATQPQLSDLQQKLSYTKKSWCRDHFLQMSIPKAKCMIFGTAVQPLPELQDEDSHRPIDTVDRFPYCGVTFSSNTRRLFEHHYTLMAEKATSATNALFAMETHVGTLSVPDGIHLYHARIDPYLTYGCEVSIDVTATGIKKLEDAQLNYLRRLLGLNPRSIRAALFSECGIMPIRYRRIILALKFAIYALSQNESNLINRTYLDAISLLRSGKSCWAGDVQNCLAKLPVPVKCDPVSFESVENLEKLIEDAEKACAQDVVDGLQSSKTPLLGGPNRATSSESVQSALRLQKYLRFVTIPAHRKGLVQFMTAEHGLRIETTRRTRTQTDDRDEDDRRRCRYCNAPTENEVHALFECNSLPSLVACRKTFFQSITNHGRITPTYGLEKPLLVFHYLLEYPDTSRGLAKFVYDLMAFFPV